MWGAIRQTNERIDDCINVGARGNFAQTFLADQKFGRSVDKPPKSVHLALVQYSDAPWAESAHLLGKELDVPVRGQVGDPEAIREIGNDIKTAPANGTRGTQNGYISDAFHVFPLVFPR